MSNEKSNLVEVQVEVKGQPCDFTTIELCQSMTGHHRFTVRVNYRPNKPSVWTVTPETIFEQIGESLAIKMKHAQSGESTDFMGVITHIDVGGKEGDQGYVVLKGGSPTLLLDVQPSMGAHIDSTLEQIVNAELDDTGATVELASQSKFTTVIPYAQKHRETPYAFLSRLAASCGEWLFYDGTKLVLGNPANETTTRAAFDIEMGEISLSAKVRNLNVELYDYDPATDDFKEDAHVEAIEGINSYMRVARDRSDTFYPKRSFLPTDRAMVDEKDIIAQMRAFHCRNYAQMSRFTANSSTCAIRLGEMVVTRLPENLQVEVGPDLGRYKVTDMVHRVDENGIYSNTFTGVPGGTEHLPLSATDKPLAFPEPATVTDNADPKNLGRVQVRFFWMGKDEHSNWLRVQSQSAGTGTAVEKNRGFHFVPEIEDQVMVAYEQGCPDRPYVAGSLFHLNNTSGMVADNNIKSITTRSGHTIEFDDTDGAEKINIRDNGGSVITFDTAAKSLTINSAENIDINAKNITIMAEENITIGAQGNVEMAADGDLNALAKGNVALQSDGDTTVNSGGALALEATSDATMSGMNAIIEGTSGAELNAVQTKVTGSAMAEVSGGIVKVN